MVGTGGGFGVGAGGLVTAKSVMPSVSIVWDLDEMVDLPTADAAIASLTFPLAPLGWSGQLECLAGP
jgi:hypothetical protein